MTCSVPGLLNASFNDGASVHLCRDIISSMFREQIRFVVVVAAVSKFTRDVMIFIIVQSSML